MLKHVKEGSSMQKELASVHFALSLQSFFRMSPCGGLYRAPSLSDKLLQCNDQRQTVLFGVLMENKTAVILIKANT